MASLDYILYSSRRMLGGLRAGVKLVSVGAGAFLLLGLLAKTVIGFGKEGSNNPNQSYSLALSSTVSDKLSSANAFLDEGNFTSARALLRANQGQVTSASDQIAIARLRMRLGDNLNAIQLLEPLLSDANYGFEATMLSGEVWLRMGRLQNAIIMANKIGDYPEGIFLKARAQYAFGNYADVDELMVQLNEPVINQRGLDIPVAYFRVRQAIDHGNYTLAHNILDRQFTNPEMLWQQRLYQIELAIREGRLEDARRWLEAITGKSAEHPAVIEVRALYAMALEDYQTAAQLFADIKRWTGGSVRRPLLHALVKYLAGDVLQAKDLAKSYLKEAPQDGVALYLLSAFEVEAENFLDVEDYVRRLARTDFASVDIGFRQYQLALVRADYDKAISVIDDMLVSQGNDPQHDRYHPLNVLLLDVDEGAVATSLRDIFNRHVALQSLVFSNEPEKALASIERAGIFDIETLQAGHLKTQISLSSHIADLENLLKADVHLLNFQSSHAKSSLATLTPKARRSLFAIRQASEISRLEYAESEFQILPDDLYHDNDRDNHIGLARLALADAIRTMDVPRIVTLTQKKWRLLEEHNVVAMLLTSIKNHPVLEGPLTELASTVDKDFYHLADLLISQAVRFDDQPDIMLAGAQLALHIGKPERAGGIYREAVQTFPNDWVVLHRFYRYLQSHQNNQIGVHFLQSLREQLLRRQKDVSAVESLLVLVEAKSLAAAKTILQNRIANNLKGYAASKNKSVYSLNKKLVYDRLALSAAYADNSEMQLALRELNDPIFYEKISADLNYDALFWSAHMLADIGEETNAILRLDNALAAWEQERAAAIRKGRNAYPLLTREIVSIIRARAALASRRRTAPSAIDRQADIRASRWAMILEPEGLVSPDVISVYATTLENAGYTKQADHLRHEFILTQTLDLKPVQVAKSGLLFQNEPISKWTQRSGFTYMPESEAQTKG